MKYEKSCGAIIFRRTCQIEYLIIFNRKGNAIGHWGFPKGHTENNETELETARREILEETGLSPEIKEGFRVVSNYNPKPNINKDVIYFLAESKNETVKIQKSELADYRWCSFEEAEKILTYDKKYLKEARKFIEENYSFI